MKPPDCPDGLEKVLDAAMKKYFEAAGESGGWGTPVLLPARCSSRLFLDVEGYSVKELWMVDNQIAVADFIATLGRLASVDADIDAHFDEDIGVVTNGCKIAALEESSNQSMKTMPGGPPGFRKDFTNSLKVAYTSLCPINEGAMPPRPPLPPRPFINQQPCINQQPDTLLTHHHQPPNPFPPSS
jgi:hypothetical protein